MLFKPRIDTRYSHTDVSSHDGIRRHGYVVDTALEI
jgi:thymidine kinase